MNPCFSVEKVNVSIKKRAILSEISFNVNEGEIVGLLGPNGSGKTTTIKTIAGLIKKNRGKISSFGVDMDTDFENYIRYINFGFDKANYYPHFSGYDNLRLFSNIYSKCSKDDIILCAKKVGLEKRIFDKVSTYSFGMRQRLNFAKSILTHSRLIILDEPFNGIDPEGIVEMRKLINDMRNNFGTSFIISSHLLDEIESVSDRLLFYKNGKIIKDVFINDYIETNHYISISNRDNCIFDSLMHLPVKTEFVEDNIIKVSCTNSMLNDVLQILQKNGYIIVSVSSKKAIEDLYLNLVGGGQIE